MLSNSSPINPYSELYFYFCGNESALEIYRVENRLFMILEAGDDFSFAQKAAMDAANPKVQKWETLMWRYQQALPAARPGEKWVLMERIFCL